MIESVWDVLLYTRENPDMMKVNMKKKLWGDLQLNCVRCTLARRRSAVKVSAISSFSVCACSTNTNSHQHSIRVQGQVKIKYFLHAITSLLNIANQEIRSG
jgi:hypothetical protein